MLIHFLHVPISNLKHFRLSSEVYICPVLTGVLMLVSEDVEEPGEHEYLTVSLSCPSPTYEDYMRKGYIY